LPRPFNLTQPNLMKNNLSIALCALVVAATSFASYAATIDATTSGYYFNSYTTDSSASNTNGYLVGNYTVGGDTQNSTNVTPPYFTQEFRNYFIFSAPYKITSGSFNIEIGSGIANAGITLDGTNHATFSIYNATAYLPQLATNVAGSQQYGGNSSVMFTNIVSGTQWGQVDFSTADNGKTLSITLNSNAIAQINSYVDGGTNVIALGGNVLNVTNISYNGWLSNTNSDNYNWISPARQNPGRAYLDVIPEPSTYALFGIGALALVVAYRRKIA
jgi:PEP-CTERM motif